MKILVVAAHPDDEVLGAGATIARHVDAGDEVTIAILGSGITSRYETPELADPQQLAHLQGDARVAATILGVEDLRLFDFPDNRFDSVALLDIVKAIEALLAELEPQVVYTHFHGDLNVDHQQTARAVLTACRPLEGCSVKRLLAFEVPSATGWGFPEKAFTPTVFCDITATLKRKVAAMESYSGERREFPHPRSAQALDARARNWGAQAGMGAAEPFMLIRELS